ncbi:MAG TPA: pyridoxamine 5'-phosphate oxidase family protein [Acidimicrobiales bacterium]
MTLTDSQLEFLQSTGSAAMITVGPDGAAKAVRVGVGVVDGKLWSSGTHDRVRTARLRRDPRCTLFVFDAGFRWLTLETTVTILDGPDVPQLSLRFFRQLQGRPDGPLSWFSGELSEEEFVATMAEERRLLYEFEVHRAYGLLAPPG